MANENRVRGNGVLGTITNNPLAVGGTSITCANFAELPAIGATEHLALTLDPGHSAGAPEIVWVTAHTALSTSVTVVRAREGSTARQHATGTQVVWGPTAADYRTICTTAGRPSGGGLPFNGQEIYDVDFDAPFSYLDSAWVQESTLGGWTTWTPTVTQSNTPTQSVTEARYSRYGRLIIAQAQLTFTGAGTGSNPIAMTYPVTPRTTSAAHVVGTFTYFDSGSTNRVGNAYYNSNTTIYFKYDGFGNAMGNTDFAIANGDALQVALMYEAAA